ncbi:MAG: bifunctional DNA-formamidopyrimidine glycosylase/DNA-(apurinic or apyrimidinic site) lyase [Hyphomicrobiales bacterium]
MPELPEVETVRRGLAPVLEGRRIVTVKLKRGDLRWPFPPRFRERIEGRCVLSVGRRAKYLLADLDSGETLLMHLGMSGRFTVKPKRGRAQNLGEFYYETGSEADDEAGVPDGAHDHVTFVTDEGTAVIYTDPRRFGAMDLVATDAREDHKLLRGMGPEPLGNTFDASHLATAFRNKTAPLKAALLDQRIVAGLGNIYVCEALNRARLSPKRLAGTLVTKAGAPTERLEVLARTIRDVLTEAIVVGGSTLRDHQTVDGAAGAFQERFRVYDREGEPCPTPGCSGVIRRIVQSGRSTFYCPRCQR